MSPIYYRCLIVLYSDQYQKSFSKVGTVSFDLSGNIAFRRPSNHRSTYWTLQSHLANDGLAHTCSQNLVSEAGAGLQWWHVALAKRVIIDKMVLVNKQDCCSKYRKLRVTRIIA